MTIDIGPNIVQAIAACAVALVALGMLTFLAYMVKKEQ